MPLGHRRLVPVGSRCAALVCLLILFVAPPFRLTAVSYAQTAKKDADREAFFEAKIRPVLVEHCFSCHSTKADSIEGGLLLDNRASLRKGGDTGPAIQAGDANGSLLLKALRHEGDLQMPPDDKLSDPVIADFTQWIQDGAYDPRDGDVITPAGKIAHEAKQHWAYQPVQSPATPKLEPRYGEWARDEIDRLIAAKLQARGVAPAIDATRDVWLRRVTYDLTGLPPTHAEAIEFRQDDSGEAFATVVDRLLASPQFGERWARHWLDVARYGDTKGYEFTKKRDYPNAFKYRDWVINSFNDDRPYDEFLRLQLAADLIDSENKSKSFAAAGYVTLGRRFLGNKHDIIDDRMDVVFRGMMGLTLSCARCHDHKYDPLSSKDYYGVYGVFFSSKEQQDDGLPLRLVDGAPRNVQVFLRGKPGNRGELAPRRFPEFFAPDEKPIAKGSGRQQLAEAITDPSNPLTARVFVNRVWGKLFGQHLVTTPSDFGLRADKPVQQDVLDRLAFDFVRDEWSIKRLIRRIVLSTVYRQSSSWRAEADQIDPENHLLWRMPRRRLDFEAMRDSILAVSGRLNRTVGGESAKIATDPKATRRTLYAFIDRQNLPDLFRTFDFALPDTHSPKRPFTTSPQQSLFLMNNTFAQLAAEGLAEQTQDAADDAARIAAMYRLLFARDPDDVERSTGLRFIRESQSTHRWTVGYGDWNADAKVLTTQAFPFFDGKTWKGREKFPDPKLGYASLHAKGGHPGNPGLAVIRRWKSPANGTVDLQGKLSHASEQGDGVRARLLRNGSEMLAEWTAKHQEVDTRTTAIEVKVGDTLELVVDCVTNTSFDSFQWPLQLKLQTKQGVQSFDVADSLQSNELDAWSRYAQTLMMTNEFHFLD